MRTSFSYLQPVWKEAILYCRLPVQVVCLSLLIMVSSFCHMSYYTLSDVLKRNVSANYLNSLCNWWICQHAQEQWVRCLQSWHTGNLWLFFIGCAFSLINSLYLSSADSKHSETIRMALQNTPANVMLVEIIETNKASMLKEHGLWLLAKLAYYGELLPEKL